MDSNVETESGGFISYWNFIIYYVMSLYINFIKYQVLKSITYEHQVFNSLFNLYLDEYFKSLIDCVCLFSSEAILCLFVN